MSMEKARLLFFEESKDLLSRMKEHLDGLGQAPEDAQARTSLFRAAHTIKGSAGIFGHPHISDFMLHLEDLLALWRDGAVKPAAESIDLVKQCRDHAQHLVTLAEQGEAASALDHERSRALAQEVDALAGTRAPQDPVVQSPSAESGPLREARQWRITYTPQPDIFRMGLDPLGPLRDLAGLRCIQNVTVAFDRVPSLLNLNPEACFLSAEISVSGVSRAIVQAQFEYYEGAASISIDG